MTRSFRGGRPGRQSLSSRRRQRGLGRQVRGKGGVQLKKRKQRWIALKMAIEGKIWGLLAVSKD
jgi:hypothetical protein